MPGAGQRLAERSLLDREIVRDGQKIAFGHSNLLAKGALARRHGDDLARRTQIRTP